MNVHLQLYERAREACPPKCWGFDWCEDAIWGLHKARASVPFDKQVFLRFSRLGTDDFMSKSEVIAVATREANLKRRLRRHLKSLGFRKSSDGSLEANGDGKEMIRNLHSAQRAERLKASATFLQQRAPKLLRNFASGTEIDPEKISPVLERVSAGSMKGDLFRLASLTWSVPVSNGFGRRIRYLVWDQQNGKLIGVIAIGDPVFNLSVRDNLIGWDVRQRGERLVNIMDAYVLGAVPPYNMLLGGKLVACLLRSREIYGDFADLYGGTTGIISKQRKRARLLAVTTSSSLGRSSVYNRLKLGDTSYFESIGYTGGWGHFHIPDKLFAELRSYLRDAGHKYADLHRFGQGPNWRLRTTRAALDALGFRDDMLKHGIRREVFLCWLASNGADILRTGKGTPDIASLLDTSVVAELARERWLIPRAQRRPQFSAWKLDDLLNLFGAQTRMLQVALKKAS